MFTYTDSLGTHRLNRCVMISFWPTYLRIRHQANIFIGLLNTVFSFKFELVKIRK